MSTGGLSQPEWSPCTSQGQERHVDCFLSILGCSWCIHPILSQNWKHSGYWCFHEPNHSVIRWSSRLLHRILVSTGWHISLIQTSCWHQTKSSVLAWPGQGRPGQYKTCLLMSTGGLNQGDVSPCIRIVIGRLQALTLMISFQGNPWWWRQLQRCRWSHRRPPFLPEEQQLCGHDCVPRSNQRWKWRGSIWEFNPISMPREWRWHCLHSPQLPHQISKNNWWAFTAHVPGRYRSWVGMGYGMGHGDPSSGPWELCLPNGRDRWHSWGMAKWTPWIIPMRWCYLFFWNTSNNNFDNELSCSPAWTSDEI